MIRFILVLIVICSSLRLVAFPVDEGDKTHRYKFLRAYYLYGHVFATNDFVSGINKKEIPINSYQAISVQLGWQTDGSRLWEQLYDRPEFGIGLHLASYNYNEEIGRPLSAYGFFNGPFFRAGKWSLNYEIEFGLAYYQKPYDEQTNPFNIAIGSHITVFFSPGMSVTWRPHPRIEIDAGFALAHYSNGAVKLPNKGINMVAPRLSLRYNFNKDDQIYVKPEIPEFQKKWEFACALSGGYKESGVVVDTLEDDFTKVFVNIGFGIANLNLLMQRHFSYKIKAGMGLDFTYDPSMVTQEYYSEGQVNRSVVPNKDKMGLGVLASFEWVISDLSVLINAGYYVLRKTIPEQTSPFYQRLGLKYHFSKHFMAGANVRAYNFSIADYIEFSVGYRLRW